MFKFAAVILGLLSGIVGFLPLLGGLSLARRATSTSNFGHATSLLVGVIASFIVLFASAIACIFLARDYVLYFASAEVAALIFSALGLGIVKMVRNRMER